MNKHVQRYADERNTKIDKIIGDSITFSAFCVEMLHNRGRKYSIHNGWEINNYNALSEGVETRISSGIITSTFRENNTIFVELDNKYTEHFTIDAIQKITKIDNKYYVIYNDNSYFKIIVE